LRNDDDFIDLIEGAIHSRNFFKDIVMIYGGAELMAALKIP